MALPNWRHLELGLGLVSISGSVIFHFLVAFCQISLATSAVWFFIPESPRWLIAQASKDKSSKNSKVNFAQLLRPSGQVVRGPEGVEGGGAEERSEALQTSSQPGACQGRRECCRRGEVGIFFAFTDFGDFAYSEHFKVLCDGLLPPERPPSHPLPLPYLASDYPRLLWTHIQVFLGG